MTTKHLNKGSHSLQGTIAGLEVDGVGIASLDDWQGTKLEETAFKLLPSARSVVVVAMAIYPEVMAHATKNKKVGEAAMKDLVESHVDFLNDQLNEAVYRVAKASHQSGLQAMPLPAKGLPADSRLLTAVFSYKHAAQAAWLGKIGRSSLLVTPEWGPRVRLACCLSEAFLEPTPAKAVPDCRGCRLCIEKCPSEALTRPQDDEPYRLNKFACNSYRSGGYCFECIRLCPAGRQN